jgi:hypothetical protein
MPSSLLPFRPHSENSIQGHPYSLGSSQHVVVRLATPVHKELIIPTKVRTGEKAYLMEKRVRASIRDVFNQLMASDILRYGLSKASAPCRSQPRAW